MRSLERVLRQRFVVHPPGRLGIERQAELLVPVEGEAGPAQGVVAVAGAGAMAGQVGGVGRDLVGDHPLLDVLVLGQAQVLLGRHVAEHRRAAPAGQRRADGAGDVVVARGDVGHQRAEHVERRLVAPLHLPLDVHVDLVHRDVARPFDHHLRALLPGPAGQLAQHVELGELGLVAGVGDRAGPQPVAQAPGDVVLRA